MPDILYFLYVSFLSFIMFHSSILICFGFLLRKKYIYLLLDGTYIILNETMICTSAFSPRSQLAQCPFPLLLYMPFVSDWPFPLCSVNMWCQIYTGCSSQPVCNFWYTPMTGTALVPVQWLNWFWIILYYLYLSLFSKIFIWISVWQLHLWVWHLQIWEAAAADSLSAGEPTCFHLNALEDILGPTSGSPRPPNAF